jgi:putative transposase
VLHRERPKHRPEHPVHVTLRTMCRSLRSPFVFPSLRNAIAAATRATPASFRIVEFSVQGDHIHLIVEAKDRGALVEGMRGLCIRIARRVNPVLGTGGRFFADRWHGRALENPRAVRNALVDVLGNFRKHRRQAADAVDVYSSAPYFQDFIELAGKTPLDDNPRVVPRALKPPDEIPVSRAKSWLLSSGWKRHGKISVSEAPAG